MFVNAFELSGVLDRPELGGAGGLIEQVHRIAGLNVVGQDGFTEDERKEVISSALWRFRNLMTSYTKTTTTWSLDCEKSASLDAQVSRSVNCNRCRQGHRYYKDRGSVAQAFIPAREVENGNVLIEVIEGRLGNVLAQGNEGTARKFCPNISRTARLTGYECGHRSAILTLRSYPGLTPTAVFQPGALVGTSDLVVSVQQVVRRRSAG